MLPSPEFLQFLLLAKKSTYAAGADSSGSSRPASSDLTFEQGDFLYFDTYLGSRDFIGEEAVWFRGQPIWGMNYHGIMLVEAVPEGFVEILHAALKLAPPEAAYRGPSELTLGDFRYTCKWQGGIDRFQGSEQIDHLGLPVYDLVFHGGRINP
ncbi:MAG TPA: DUF5680 domain-containing protein [Longilinea sp.]|nr:DUF5680 domain-containing protein [Longilinea sp.]